MKAIIILFSMVFFFISCENKTGGALSKECQVIKEYENCIFDKDGDCDRILKLLSLMNTDHEHFIDKFLNGTNNIEKTFKEVSGNISKRESQRLFLRFYESHKEVIKEDDSYIEVLSAVREHYNCKGD